MIKKDQTDENIPYIIQTPYLSALDFRIMDFGVYFKLGENSSSKPTRYFVEFLIEFYYASFWTRV